MGRESGGEMTARSNWKRFSVMGFTFLILFFPTPLSAETGFGDPVRGQSLFQGKGCVRCHAIRGAGGRIGPDLGRKAVRSSFFEIISGMWNHSQAMEQKMREFHLTRPTLEGSDLADLVSFLYFLNYFDEPGDPRVGKILFTEKRCIECHHLGGEGGEEGPSLENIPRGASPLRIAQDLWNHGLAMITAMEKKGLDVPQFEDSEIVDLISFLRTGGQRQANREFQSAGDPEMGHHLFKTKGCARCHAIFGKGEGIGPDLGRVELRGSVTQVAGKMWNHWPGMAKGMEDLGIPRPEFQEDDLANLLAYIFIVRFDGLPGNPDQGKRIFAEKKCSNCHGAKGRRGIGPSLDEIASKKTKESIMQSMWNHAPRMGERMVDQRIPWPRFEGDELADLFAYFETGLKELEP